MRKITCNICGIDDTEKLFEGYDRFLNVDRAPYTVVRCKKCNLVYINPQPTEEELLKYYPPEYPPYAADTNQVFEYGPVTRTIQKTYHRIFPKNNRLPKEEKPDRDNSTKRVLDFGCGNGRFLLSLAQEHPQWELYGFDISSNPGVKKLTSNVTLYYDDFSALEQNLPHGNFDKIYLNNVLEHLPNPCEMLNRLRLLLAVDGEMILEVPNIDSFKFRFFGKYFSGLDIPRHLFDFSPSTVEGLSKKAGLTTSSISLSGSTKSTVLSLYYALGIQKRKFNPIIFRLLQGLTRLIGESRIDNDVLTFKLKKSPSYKI